MIDKYGCLNFGFIWNLVTFALKITKYEILCNSTICLNMLSCCM